MTDESWKCAYGPWREGDLIMGAAYDARREMAGWDAAGFDDSKWRPPKAPKSNRTRNASHSAFQRLAGRLRTNIPVAFSARQYGPTAASDISGILRRSA